MAWVVSVQMTVIKELRVRMAHSLRNNNYLQLSVIIPTQFFSMLTDGSFDP